MWVVTVLCDTYKALPILRCEKVGKEVWYWPAPDTVRSALDAVRDYLDNRFTNR